ARLSSSHYLDALVASGQSQVKVAIEICDAVRLGFQSLALSKDRFVSLARLDRPWQRFDSDVRG
ncbi:hypothetical protein, partial [Bradyrhizobium sp. 143]|uniref:hypothetical protein n=1 Tax=Bradyrhizobium sp. 143 TaxID=2782619 RepID=UPI001FF91F28